MDSAAGFGPADRGSKSTCVDECPRRPIHFLISYSLLRYNKTSISH